MSHKPYARLSPTRSLHMRLATRLSPLALLVAASASAQQLPPIRQLGPVVAKAKDPFGNIASVRHLSSGRVLVNDPSTRQVVMLDEALAPMSVVADSSSSTANAYGPRGGGLIP